jgi:hypothetical protein
MRRELDCPLVDTDAIEVGKRVTRKLVTSPLVQHVFGELFAGSSSYTPTKAIWMGVNPANANVATDKQGPRV